MINCRAAVLVVLAMAIAGPVFAQSDEGIEPDRPDVTDSTHIVPAGLVQIEVGGIYTRDAPGQTSGGSPFMVRVGLTDWLEARIGADGLMTQSSADARVTGFGNVQIAAKLRLWADPGGAPVLAILPAVTLPTADASRGLGSGDADVSIALLTGTDIARRGHIDINYGIAAIGAGQRQAHFTQHLVSASLSAALTDRWNPYVEAFWFSRTDPDSGSETAMDAGVIYELGSRFAIDGGVQFGLVGPASDFAAFGGFSVIVGGERALNGRQRKVPTPKVNRR